MPLINSAEVVPKPIALGQEGRILLESEPTLGGVLTASVRISERNNVFFVPQKKSIAAKPNGSTSFTLERRPGPGLTSPHSVTFFITVKETGVVDPAKDSPLVDIEE